MIISNSFADGSTVVENSFIDQYMTKAPGEYVKIYFLLLRRLHSSHINFSISDLADTLELTEGDILRALKYWAREGLLLLHYNDHEEIISLEMGRFNNTDTAPLINNDSMTSRNITSFKSRQTRNESQKKTEVLDKQALKDLALVAETYLGKQLTRSDIETINFFYESLHFSADLIEYLIEYCAENGHKNWAYINAVAIAWNESQIKTVEEAKNQTASFSGITRSIFNSFGLNNRRAIPEELAYIKKWHEEFGFSVDIIQEACKRTVMFAKDANWFYANKILENWFKDGVTKLEDIEPLDAVHKLKTNKSKFKKATIKKSFDNFEGRSYDMSELERQLLNHSQEG